MTALLLRNGRLGNTRTGAQPTDILIENGAITRIADSIDPGTHLLAVELEGRNVVPGLWDAHVHLAQHALTLHRIDVSIASSAAEAALLMAAASRIRPPQPGLPLIGQGFRDGLWPDVPTAAVLDAALGDLPTVLISADLHCCWLNSAALVRFGRAGHPTGVFREDDAFALVGALGDVPESVLDGWVADAARAASARGVVGVLDLEMVDNIEVWQRRFAGGFDSLRVDAGLYTEHLEPAIAAGRRSGDLLPGTGGLLRVGPYKVLIDGSLNTRTAYCSDDYPGLEGDPHGHGMLTVAPEDLVSLLRRATSAGLVPAVHAIGDEANRIALDAFETIGRGGRIEHAQLVRDRDLPRFASLGVTASVQPEHAMDDRDVADRYWSGRTGRAFAVRSLLDAGATVVFGSDAPVAPLDPWVTMAAAIWRSRDGLPAWHPEQTITVDQAMAASTGGRASVMVGDAADLCVVDDDPATASPDRFRAMPVAATLVAGAFTYDAL